MDHMEPHRDKRSRQESNNEFPQKKKVNGYTLWYLAAKNNNTDQCKELLEKQVNVNGKSSNGNTALHEAAQYNSVDVCGVLLGHGADVSAKNKTGYTPLHVSAQYNSIDTCKLLLEHKSDVGVKNRCNNTPLHVAARHNSSEVCKILLENKADMLVDAKGINDCTPLHLAVEHNCVETCTQLLEYKANVNAFKKGNRTPLHEAASKSGSDKVCQVLIHYGADIHAMNSNEKTALHICCEIMIQQCKEARKFYKTSGYLNTMEILLIYGADPYKKNLQGASCLSMSECLPEIQNILKESRNMCLFQKWIKSNPKNMNYKSILSKVVKGQYSKKVSFYEYYKEPIGSGGFSHVYAGVNIKDGREVAVKKIDITKLPTRQYQREIKNLVRLRGSPNIVNYLDFEEKGDTAFVFLELMEGTLEGLLDQPNSEVSFKEMCHDVVNALQFLHSNKIIHRDIKPRNILYTFTPRITLKLADFGLSTRIERETPTVMHSTAGTRRWMAPEVLRSQDHSTASDVFSCGLVLYYLLAAKKHPFSSDKIVCKSNYFMTEHEITTNILSHTLNIDGCQYPEARHLIEMMLHVDKDQRPSAQEMLSHPFFWSNQKKIKFFEATGNQPEVFQSHSKPSAQSNSSDFKKELESSFGVQFNTRPWSEWSASMVEIYKEMMSSGKRKYLTSSAVELLRFIRNAYQHVSDNSRSCSFQKFLLTDYVFFDNFESLVIEVYKAVTKHGWDNRPEIKNAMSNMYN